MEVLIGMLKEKKNKGLFMALGGYMRQKMLKFAPGV